MALDVLTSLQHLQVTVEGLHVSFSSFVEDGWFYQPLTSFKKSRACTVVRKVLKKCRGGKKRLTIAATKLLKSWKKLDSTSTKLEKDVGNAKQKEKRETVPSPSSSSVPSSESSRIEQPIYCIDSIVREKSTSLLSNVLSRGQSNGEFRMNGRYGNWTVASTQQSIRTEWTVWQLWLKSISSRSSMTREINTKCAFAAEWQTLVTWRILSWNEESYLERSLHLGLQQWQQRYGVGFSPYKPAIKTRTCNSAAPRACILFPLGYIALKKAYSP